MDTVIPKIIYDFVMGLVTNFLSNLLSTRNKSPIESANSHNNNLQIDEACKELIKPVSYNQEISERLEMTRNLLSTTYDKLTFSKISDYLSFENVGLVEGFFQAKLEPTLDFLSKYCDFFGIEYQWLRHGEGNIFIKSSRNEILAINYLKYILELEPKEICFVRSRNENGRSGIILRLTNNKFLVLPSTYNISSIVGGTGQIQIVSLYYLIRELSRSHLRFRQNGLKLEGEEFSNLFDGKIYPGKYFKCYRIYDHWWDDLLDYNHTSPIANEYEVKHGIEFLKAQEIIRFIEERRVA